MRLDVFGQMVRSHKLLVALLTLKPLLPGVRPPVPLQLVRPRELLPAKQPITHERSLPRVPPEMSPQV